MNDRSCLHGAHEDIDDSTARRVVHFRTQNIMHIVLGNRLPSMLPSPVVNQCLVLVYIDEIQKLLTLLHIVAYDSGVPPLKRKRLATSWPSSLARIGSQ